MKVLSFKKNSMTLELDLFEQEALFMLGLQLELDEMGCKCKVVSIAQAERMGLKLKKGAKTLELTEEDSRLMIEKAVNDCLRKKIAEEEAKRAKEKKAKKRKK
jgi:hypothetical protein